MRAAAGKRLWDVAEVGRFAVVLGKVVIDPVDECLNAEVAILHKVFRQIT